MESLNNAKNEKNEKNKIFQINDNPFDISFNQNSSENLSHFKSEKLRCFKSITSNVQFVNEIIFLEDLNLFATSTRSGSSNSITLWDLNKLRILKNLSGHNAKINTVIKLNNGKLASNSLDNTIKIWNTITGICVKTIQVVSSLNSCLLEGPNDILIMGDENGIQFLNFTNPQEEALLRNISHNNQKACRDMIFLSPILIACGSSFNINIYNLENVISKNDIEPLKILSAHTALVTCLYTLENGEILLSGGWDAIIYMWDWKNVSCVRKIPVYGNFLNQFIRFNENIIATIGWVSTVKFLDISNPKLVSSLKTSTRALTFIKIRKDRVLWSCDIEGKIRFWAHHSFK